MANEITIGAARIFSKIVADSLKKLPPIDEWVQMIDMKAASLGITREEYFERENKKDEEEINAAIENYKKKTSGEV